jgi:hypothetical protein
MVIQDFARPSGHLESSARQDTLVLPCPKSGLTVASLIIQSVWFLLGAAAEPVQRCLQIFCQLLSYSGGSYVGLKYLIPPPPPLCCVAYM